ncbi:hypothetical protein [Nonomuraea sp. SBT364]|uniref:hypothetical protein n=1 Tax=Nonomuraea sp. SBT364 TaxID=1580530 RepID=UPI00066A8F5B|nr:hypothetical protein [Nonomuraea sp. SBT364]
MTDPSHQTLRPEKTAAPPARTGPGMLRLALLGLVAIGILGAAFELAVERHWGGPAQLIPWAALLLLGIALALALRDSPRTLTVVRVLAAAVLLASVYGVFTHVSVNHGMGAFDPSWNTLSTLTQWWYAFTKSVGNAPPLAPGMLAQSALLLLITSTLRARRA